MSAETPLPSPPKPMRRSLLQLPGCTRFGRTSGDRVPQAVRCAAWQTGLLTPVAPLVPEAIRRAAFATSGLAEREGVLREGIRQARSCVSIWMPMRIPPMSDFSGDCI